MRSLLKNKYLWSAAILAVLTIFFTYYIANNWEDFLELRLEHPSFLIVVGAGALTSLYSNGALMDVVLRPLGLRLRRMETFGLAIVTRLGNQVAPGKLGLAIRASYLKRKHGLALSKFASSLGAAHILMYLFSSLLGLGALLALKQADASLDTLTFGALLAGLSIFLLGLLLFSPRLKEGDNFFTRHLSRVVNGWFIIRHDRHILGLASVWALINVLSMAAVTFGSFNALGANIGILAAFFITSLVILGGLIGITPAGLGINEGLIVVAASVLGVPTPVALTAALIRRVTSMGVLILIAPVFTRKLFRASFRKVVHDQRS